MTAQQYARLLLHSPDSPTKTLWRHTIMSLMHANLGGPAHVPVAELAGHRIVRALLLGPAVSWVSSPAQGKAPLSAAPPAATSPLLEEISS